MKLKQVIAMWQLVSNNSIVLKGLLITALTCQLIVFSLVEGPTHYMFQSIASITMAFSTLLLLLNAARLTERQQLYVVPEFRKSLLLVCTFWFLINITFIIIPDSQRMLNTNLQPSEVTLMLFGSGINMMGIWLTALAIAVVFSRTSALLIIIGLIILGTIPSYLNYSWLSDWSGLFFSSYGSIPLRIVQLLILFSLLHWAFSTSNYKKLDSTIATYWLKKIIKFRIVNRTRDVNAQQVLRQNQSPYFFSYGWCLVLAGLIWIGNLAYRLEPIEFAGLSIMLEAFLIFGVYDSSIFHLRHLWLKGLGGREPLFDIWDSKKTSEVLDINLSLIILNIILAWWHSLSPQLTILIIISVYVLSFFNLYAKSLATAHYWNPTTISACVMFSNAFVVSFIISYSGKIELITFAVISLLIISLTMFFRAKLKSQISQIDWLLMPKP